jgi:hypothetical protein
MPQIAASTTFFVAFKDSLRRKVVVTVFVPELIEEDYACEITWGGLLRTRRFWGTDSVQALVYAMGSIRLDVERLSVQGWRFSRCPDGAESLDLDAIYPRL